MTNFMPMFNLDQLQLLAVFAASHLPGVNGIFPMQSRLSSVPQAPHFLKLITSALKY